MSLLVVVAAGHTDPEGQRRVAAYLSCIDFDCNSKLEALVQLGSKAVTPLIAVLEESAGASPAASGMPVNLVRVCVALGRLRDARATPALERLLRHDDPVLRAQALVAIGRIGDRSVVGSVTQRLRDRDAYVRESAAGALAVLGGSAERAALDAALAIEASVNARSAMVEALRAIGARAR